MIKMVEIIPFGGQNSSILLCFKVFGGIDKQNSQSGRRSSGRCLSETDICLRAFCRSGSSSGLLIFILLTFCLTMIINQYPTAAMPLPNKKEQYYTTGLYIHLISLHEIMRFRGRLHLYTINSGFQPQPSEVNIIYCVLQHPQLRRLLSSFHHHKRFPEYVCDRIRYSSPHTYEEYLRNPHCLDAVFYYWQKGFRDRPVSAPLYRK